MKNKTIKIASLIGLLLLTTSSLFAQDSGEITYVRTMNIHKLLPPSQAMLKSMIPEFKKDKITIRYNSEFAKITEKSIGKSNGAVMIQSGGGDGTKYIDRKQNASIELIKTDGKLYGTEKPVKTKLKLVDETKTINGYKCHKAVGQSQMHSRTESNTKSTEEEIKTEITYWYTKQLSGGISPMGPTNLPGTVIAIESDAMVYEMDAYTQKNIITSSIAPPAGYQKITQEQFTDLQEEKIEELQDSFSN